MNNFIKKNIDAVWAKAQPISGFDSNIWRQDFAGAWIRRDCYNQNTKLGWQIWYLDNASQSNDIDNLIPVQYENAEHMTTQFNTQYEKYIIKPWNDENLHDKNVSRKVYPFYFTTIVSSVSNRKIECVKEWCIRRKRWRFWKYEVKPDVKKICDKYDKIIWGTLIFCLLAFFACLSYFLYIVPCVGKLSSGDISTFDGLSPWGIFGDSVLAFIGCIIAFLSAYLLYSTLKMQIDSNAEVCRVNELTRRDAIYNKLDTSFTSLMSIYRPYKEQVNKLECMDSNSCRSQFHSYEIVQGKLIDVYRKYYSKHRKLLAAYFRVVYRILEMIDSSDVEDKNKVHYVKIFRSQLTDTEMLLLRYNAYTSEGEKMQRYINDYNLLKLLPYTMQPEIPQFPDTIEENDLEDFLRNFHSQLTESVLRYNEGNYTDPQSVVLQSSSSIEMLAAFSIESPSQISVEVHMDSEQDISSSLIQKFWINYLEDVFIYSSYELYQREKELLIMADIKTRLKNFILLEFTIKQIQGHTIILSSNQLRVPFHGITPSPN